MNFQVKDFQKATAQRIYELMHDYGRHRVLLADEVGLGKTIVANEVIRLIKEWHHTELHDHFFKVVYICSNANIANQNIRKLGIDEKMNFSDSRLSMQHLQIAKTRQRLTKKAHISEQIIPLTPSTSFKVSETAGTKEERALLYAILRSLPDFQGYEDELSEYLKTKNVASESWHCVVERYSFEVESCGEDYLYDMHTQFLNSYDKERFIQFVVDAKSSNHEHQRKTIGLLRQIFAQISIGLLDPDLVIMDEFQRFSSILDNAYPTIFHP